MFGLGFGEILIILVLALILLGPARLPDVAKQLGKGLRDFKRATDDLKNQFEREMYVDDHPTPRIQPPSAAAPVPAPPPGQAPAATAENVPGLEAATAEAGQIPPQPPPEREPEPGQSAGATAVPGVGAGEPSQAP